MNEEKTGLNKNQRIYKWDNLKFVLILLVVTGHFISGFTEKSDTANRLFLIIYTFHMPLFIFIAGLFSKSAINKGRLKIERVYMFLLIYLLLTAVTYFIKLLLGTNENIDLLGTYHVQWYMFAMASFLSVMYLLRHLPPYAVMIFSVLLACLSGYDKNIGNLFCLSKIISFFPFFAAGYYLDANKLLHFLQRRKVRVASVAVLVGFVVIVSVFIKQYSDNFRPLLIVSSPQLYGKLPHPQLGAAVRLAYYVLCSIVSISFMSLVPRRKTFYSEMGTRTLAVYFWHVPMQMLFFSTGLSDLIKSVIPLPWVLVLILTSVILTLILSLPIFSKPFESLVNMKLRKIPGEELNEKE